MNRVGEIQLKRQVRMKKKADKFNYDLVSVCEKCFQCYRDIVRVNEIELSRGSQSVNKLGRSRRSSIGQKSDYIDALSVLNL